jgi:hypothetical protein
MLADRCGCVQDPAGFLHWLHQRLHGNDPHRIRAPRPLPPNATPAYAEAAARADLLTALKPHGEHPWAYAIVVDEAGYLVSSRRPAFMSVLPAWVYIASLISSCCIYASLPCACGSVQESMLCWGPCFRC